MAEISGKRRAPYTGTLQGRPLAVLLADAITREIDGTLTLTAFPERAIVELRAGRVAGVVLRGRRALPTEAVLASLFALPTTTTFALRESSPDDDRAPLTSVPIDPWPVIWRGLREHPPVEHVERALARLTATIRLTNVDVIARLRLEDQERALCEELAAKPSTLGEIVIKSPMPSHETRLLVYCLGLARALSMYAPENLDPAELGVEGVRARARRIADESPHAALGLPPGASTEAVRAAFFRLARAWHPERLPPELECVREECTFVFARMADAYDRIRSAEKESWSLRPPPFGENTSMREIDEALANADFARADRLARSLVRTVVDGPNARAVIAWCEAEAGASIDRAIAALDRILAGDPHCTRALYYRGKLNVRAGRNEDAVRDFRRLLRMSPHHEGARHELGLLARAQLTVEKNMTTSGLRRLYDHLTR